MMASVMSNEDLVHETLFEVIETYKELVFDKGIIAYAYSKLNYKILNEERKIKNRTATLDEKIETVRQKLGQDPHSGLFDIERQYDFKELGDALNTLSNFEKSIIHLKYEGYSGEEIMQKLGIKNRNTFYSHTSRTVKKLEKVLGVKS